MAKKYSLPLVSIIISTYNRSALLRLAVESALAQTYPAIEIIVIDDGSTDDTAAVMRQYAGRIIYVRQENQGPNQAVARGLQIASGDYIGILDHDDLYLPTKIERQAAILNSRPKVGIVNCGYRLINEKGECLGQVLTLPAGDVLKELVCGNSAWSGALLYRRECFERVKIRGSYCPDWEFMLALALAGYQFASIPEPLGCYRIMAGSLMGNVARMEQGMLEILDAVFTDPRLPADVLAVKDRAYSNCYTELSLRYFATGYWEDAQRNLDRAIALRPAIAERPENLLELFYLGAMDVRTPYPVQYINGVFDHLPDYAQGLGEHRSQLLGQVYAGLALRSYATGDIAEAKRQLVQAITLSPKLGEQSEDFKRLVCNYAVNLPVDTSLQYLETVFANLPITAERLGRLRTHVVGDVSIAFAFEDYAAGRHRSVVRRVLHGLYHHPSWLSNKGVLAILLRSLVSLPNGLRHSTS